MSFLKSRFPDINYNFSLSAGDFMSAGVFDSQLRPMRRVGLQYNRLVNDLKSVRPRGQGVGLRIQRRFAGRGVGYIGRTFIPQDLGIVTRLANRVFGRQAQRLVQTHFNNKMRVRSRIDGRQLTANIREVVTEDKSQVRAMRKRMTAQAKQMGISKQTVSMRKFLHEVTMNMRKGKRSEAAPIQSGNLRRSIINRGFVSNPKDAIARGMVTVGSSMGGNPYIADQAPYWFKTLYGGRYINTITAKPFTKTRANSPHWFGKAVFFAMKDSFGANSVSGLLYQNLQPPRPGPVESHPFLSPKVDLTNEQLQKIIDRDPFA